MITCSRDGGMGGPRARGCPCFFLRLPPADSGGGRMAGVLLAWSLACAQAAAYDGTGCGGSPGLRMESMNGTSSAMVRVEADIAELEVAITATAPDAIRLRYRVRNTGDAPLAVFDRGDRQAMLAGRLAPGAVAAPTFEAIGDDVVLRHVARGTVPGGFTGPTVPATPLALELAAGATVDGEFGFSIPTARPPVRVRWCLGVAPLAGDGFLASQEVAAGILWQAGDEALVGQLELCTPWWDMASGQFAPHAPE